MDNILSFLKKIIPEPVFRFFQPLYHKFLAYGAAFFYLFPGKRLTVIGITGTNGKTTVTHLLTDILEEAGENVASISSLRFKIKDTEWRNELKMTMPGRFRLQKFLHDAVASGCRYAVIEVTSEGIKQFRHLGIDFFMAVLTNVTPEHIESHGSFENYRNAKAELFRRSKIHILNGEDPHIEYFLKIPAETRMVYTKKDLPSDIHVRLLGDFNLENAAAAYHAAKIIGIDTDSIKHVLERTSFIAGRLEFIQKEPFSVVVDYAHTPDALEKVYKTLRPPTSSTLGVKSPKTPSVFPVGGRLVCILGAAGGGRDKWKRPEMGRIAAKFCDEVILTNEDPYEENPLYILDDIERGFSEIKNPKFHYQKILDRREAIRRALQWAKEGDTVIITGKGAEPWIMGPNNLKIPWDDRDIAREELKMVK